MNIQMQLQAPNSDQKPSDDFPSSSHDEDLDHGVEQFGCSAEREESIEEYLLGRLGAAEATELLSHLSSCERCRVHFEELRDLLG